MVLSAAPPARRRCPGSSFLARDAVWCCARRAPPDHLLFILSSSFVWSVRCGVWGFQQQARARLRSRHSGSGWYMGLTPLRRLATVLPAERITGLWPTSWTSAGLVVWSLYQLSWKR